MTLTMRNLKRSTLITVSFSLVLMGLERTGGAAAPVKDEKYVLKGPQYPLEELPIIDSLQIEEAFTRRHYMRFLMKCVFFEGHCDIIGKWLKPRTFAAILGKCLGCTKYQEKNMERWLLTLIEYNKDLFRVAMIKVCVDMNIPVPEEERNRIIPFLKKQTI